MVRIHTRKAAWSAALGAFGAAALLSAAPSASAEPAPAPPPLPPAPMVPAAAPAPAPLPPVPAPLPLDAAVPLAAPAPGALDQPLPAAEVPHLSSPENLPPGATLTPTGPNQNRGMSYLRELWHAVQTQEVSKADAVLLLTQRPLDAPAPAGVPVGPQAPLPQAPLPVEPAPVPAPAPVPVPAPAPVPAPLPPVQ